MLYVAHETRPTSATGVLAGWPGVWVIRLVPVDRPSIARLHACSAKCFLLSRWPCESVCQRVMNVHMLHCGETRYHNIMEYAVRTSVNPSTLSVLGTPASFVGVWVAGVPVSSPALALEPSPVLLCSFVVSNYLYRTRYAGACRSTVETLSPQSRRSIYSVSRSKNTPHKDEDNNKNKNNNNT